jgi:hypothetical protein
MVRRGSISSGCGISDLKQQFTPHPPGGVLTRNGSSLQFVSWNLT